MVTPDTLKSWAITQTSLIEINLWVDQKIGVLQFNIDFFEFQFIYRRRYIFQIGHWTNNFMTKANQKNSSQVEEEAEEIHLMSQFIWSFIWE